MRIKIFACDYFIASLVEFLPLATANGDSSCLQGLDSRE